MDAVACEYTRQSFITEIWSLLLLLLLSLVDEGGTVLLPASKATVDRSLSARPPINIDPPTHPPTHLACRPVVGGRVEEGVADEGVKAQAQPLEVQRGDLEAALRCGVEWCGVTVHQFLIGRCAARAHLSCRSMFRSNGSMVLYQSIARTHALVRVDLRVDHRQVLPHRPDSPNTRRERFAGRAPHQHGHIVRPFPVRLLSLGVHFHRVQGQLDLQTAAEESRHGRHALLPLDPLGEDAVALLLLLLFFFWGWGVGVGGGWCVVVVYLRSSVVVLVVLVLVGRGWTDDATLLFFPTHHSPGRP
jgi:hypothetical protein